MKKCNCTEFGPVVLRAVLGLLFVIPGIAKLFNPANIIGMLGKLGFPAAALFGWVLILLEIGFGAAMLAGWKLKYTVWPLVVILVVATLTVTIPSFGTNPMAYINLLFHVVAIGSLVSLYLTGPGQMAVKQ